MSDLISRNALLDAMPKNDELLSVDVRRIICESPIIDAEPARHGRWIPMQPYLGFMKCSVCGMIWETESPHCPSCGAKMDGEAE